MARFSLRRAVVRVLSSSPSTALSTQARTFTSLRIQSSSLPTVQQSTFPLFQRRLFASEEAAAQSELEADGAIKKQHGNNSIASAATEGVESKLSPSEEAAAAASSDSIIDETIPTQNSSAPPPAAESPRSVASEAAASIAGTAAAVGDSLSSAAGFGNTSARSAQEPPEPSKTVYVGNLFFDVRSEDLRQEFEQAGPVVNAKIIMDSRGLSKGFGYVEFDTIESATKAIELYNLQNFEGRRISVQYSISKNRHPSQRGGGQPPRPLNPPTKTLFIGNMSFEMSDRDLNHLFREIKNVIDVRVAIDRRTGQPRGFAHAEFTDVGSAERAMAELRGKVIGGRALRLDYSVSTGRASLGGAGGSREVSRASEGGEGGADF